MMQLHFVFIVSCQTVYCFQTVVILIVNDFLTSKLFIYSLTIGYIFTFATTLFFAYLLYTFSAKKVEHVNAGSSSLLA